MENQQQPSFAQKNPNQTDNTEQEEFLASFLNHQFKDSRAKQWPLEQSFTKENTHQFSYEGVLKQVNEAVLYQKQLKQEFEMTKNQQIQRCFKDLLKQLTALSKENEQLRVQYKGVSRKSVRHASPLDTPRSQSIVNSHKHVNYCAHSKASIHNFNSSSKKQRVSLQIQQRMMKSQANYFHGLGDFNEQPMFGRGSLPNSRPLLFKKIQECHQDTERKPLGPNLQANLNTSFCFSEIYVAQNQHQNRQIDSKSSFNEQSMDFHSSSFVNAPNLFLDYINMIVEQEKDRQRQIAEDINMGVNYEQACQSDLLSQMKNKNKTVQDLQQQSKQTHERIQKLEKFYLIYEREIEQMNKDIQNSTLFSQQIMEQRGQKIAMQKQVLRGISVQKQLKSMQVEYKKAKQRQELKIDKQLPGSLKTIIMVLSGMTADSTKNCYQILKEGIKNPKKFKKEREQKSCKLKKLVQSMELGRKKFNQLLQIYNGRIQKLEEKIRKIEKKRDQLQSRRDQ